MQDDIDDRLKRIERKVDWVAQVAWLAGPVGDLIKDDAGHLYGTAGAGGVSCAEPFDRCGNAFRFTR